VVDITPMDLKECKVITMGKPKVTTKMMEIKTSGVIDNPEVEVDTSEEEEVATSSKEETSRTGKVAKEDTTRVITTSNGSNITTTMAR